MLFAATIPGATKPGMTIKGRELTTTTDAAIGGG
jgi:hypothetical protein